MGLDAVEIVLRAEELYATTFTDDEAGQVRTVGDFYGLICSKLGLSPLLDPQTSAELPKISESERAFLILRKTTPLPNPAEVLPWTPQTVWDMLVAIFVDQQGLESDRIRPSARIADDVGVD